MSRRFLLTTPEGIKTLYRQHKTCSEQAADGFISTEMVFRDAMSAHELHLLIIMLRETLRKAGRQIPAGSRILRSKINEALSITSSWD